jgi:hypothetical protein
MPDPAFDSDVDPDADPASKRMRIRKIRIRKTASVLSNPLNIRHLAARIWNSIGEHFLPILIAQSSTTAVLLEIVPKLGNSAIFS